MIWLDSNWTRTYLSLGPTAGMILWLALSLGVLVSSLVHWSPWFSVLVWFLLHFGKEEIWCALSWTKNHRSVAIWQKKKIIPQNMGWTLFPTFLQHLLRSCEHALPLFGQKNIQSISGTCRPLIWYRVCWGTTLDGWEHWSSFDFGDFALYLR